MDLIHVFGNEFFLLGRAKAYKHHIRAAAAVDRIDSLLRVGEIAVVRAGQHKARILGAQLGARLFGDPGLGAQQIQAHILLCHRSDQMLGEFDAGNLSVKLLAQDLRCIDDADTVRQHQRGAVDNPHVFAVPAAQVNDLRVRCDDIALLPRAKAGHGKLDSLLHRNGMEMHAQNRSGFHPRISYDPTLSSNAAHSKSILL